jgi:DNA polymerase elongation subunit (family B)
MNVEELLKRDPNTITDEEAEFLANESQLHFSFEKSIKLILNSIYGAFANEFFHFYNVNIAETITMQGQDAIKFTEVVANRYFNEFFHKDTELLTALGVPPGTEVPRVAKPPVLYCDTDSSYITFQDAMAAVGWTGSARDFVLTVDRVRLKGYFKRVLDKYAKDRNVENYLDFELETIADNAIFVSKKKYIQNIVWKDGKDFASLSYIKPTGLEIVQSSTPVFCREKLTEIMKFIFSKSSPSTENYAELIRLI